MSKGGELVGGRETRFSACFQDRVVCSKKKKSEEKRKKKGLMVDLGDPVISLELFRASIIEDALKITFFKWWMKRNYL